MSSLRRPQRAHPHPCTNICTTPPLILLRAQGSWLGSVSPRTLGVPNPPYLWSLSYNCYLAPPHKPLRPSSPGTVLLGSLKGPQFLQPPNTAADGNTRHLVLVR